MSQISLAFRLAWRDIRKNKFRTILGVLLFALPVTFTLVVSMPYSYPVHETTQKDTLNRVYVRHRACGEGTSAQDYNCLPSSKLELNDIPDIERIKLSQPNNTHFAASLVPEYHISFVASGINGNNTKINVNAIHNRQDLYNEIPNNGEIYLDNATAFVLGAKIGDRIPLRIEEKEITLNVANIGSSTSTMPIDDVPLSLPAKEDLKSASLPNQIEAYWVTREYSDYDSSDYQVSAYGPNRKVTTNVTPYAWETIAGSSFEDHFAVLIVFILGLLLIACMAGPIFTVSARRRLASLGLLAAQGANRIQLGAISFAEASIVSILGLFLGLVISSPWWLHIGRFPWDYLLAATIVCIISGIVAAVMPAIHASKANPVLALAGGSNFSISKVRFYHFIPPILAICFMAIFHTAEDLLLILVAIIAAAICTILSAPIFLSILLVIARVLAPPERMALRDTQRNYQRVMPATAALIGSTFITLSIAWTINAEQEWYYQTPPRVIYAQAGLESATTIPFDQKLEEIKHDYSTQAQANTYSAQLASNTSSFHISAMTQDGTTYTEKFEHFDFLRDSIYYTPTSNLYIVDPEMPQLLHHLYPEQYSVAQTEAAVQALKEGKVVVDSISLLEGKDQSVYLTEDGKTSIHKLKGHLIGPQGQSLLHAHALISKKTIEQLGYETFYQRTLFARNSDLTWYELLKLQTMKSEFLSIQTSGPDIGQKIDQNLITFAGWLTTIGIAVVIVTLAAGESRRDIQTMLSIGATRNTIIRFCLCQGASIGLLGTLAGLLFAGIFMALGANQMRTLDQPWELMALLAVSTPLVSIIASFSYGAFTIRNTEPK